MTGALSRLIRRLALTLPLALCAGTSFAKEVPGTTSAQSSVSPDGTATYAIPLMVPPGTAGIEPKLSLAYSSRAGNSPYGFGWSVAGLSSIQRGPRNLRDDGVVAGVELSDKDALFLDGEELVEVRSSVSGVREFRTRVDGIARVRAFGWTESGPSYLVVETRAGLTMTYGGAADARVALANGTTIAWLSSRIEDRSGNYMTLHYRFGPAGVGDLDYALARVDYTGNDRFGLAPYAALSFTYDDLPATEAYGIRFIAGQRTSLTARLKEIASMYKGQILRRYIPAFGTPGEGDRFATLRSLREVGAAGSSYRPLIFDYPQSKPGWTDSNLLRSIRDLPGLSDMPEALPDGYRLARLSVGGAVVPTILVGASANGKIIRAAFAYDTGQGRWVKETPLDPPFLFAAADGVSDDVIVADLDGDGRDEVIVGSTANGNLPGTYWYDGTKWQSGPRFPLPTRGRTLQASGALAVDITDPSGAKIQAIAWSLTDPATGTPTAGAVRWSNGTWSTLNKYAPLHPTAVAGGRAATTAIAMDVDCDGKRELVYVPVPGSMHAEIYRAGASGWALESNPVFALNLPALPSIAAVRVGDMNNDHCPDLVFSASSGPARMSGIKYASINGWIDETRPFPDAAFWKESDTQPLATSGELIDLDGDGVPEIVDQRTGGLKVYQLTGSTWADFTMAAPPSGLGSSLPDHELNFGLLRLPGSSSLTWLSLRPRSPELVPLAWRFNPARGWEADQTFTIPIDLAAFDKVDLGVRFVDLNNDGHPDVLWSRKKKDGAVEQAAYIFQSGAPQPWRKDDRFILPAALVQEDYGATGVFIVDLDGDGVVDLVQSRLTGSAGHQSALREAWINCSTHSTCAGIPDTKVSGYWQSVRGTELQALLPPDDFAQDGAGDLGIAFQDVNGDGLADFVVAREIEHGLDSAGHEVPDNSPAASYRYDLYARTWLNEGGRKWTENSEFKLPVPLVRPLVRVKNLATVGDPEALPGSLFTGTGVQLVDLDGDRLPDLFWNYGGFHHTGATTGVAVVPYAAKGARMGSSHGWVASNPAYEVANRLDDDPAHPHRQLQLDDLNGDGNIDLVFSENGSSLAFLNSGRGWTGSDPAYAIPAKAIRSGGGDQGFRLIDLNGDALPDVAYNWTTESGTVRGAYVNTGTGWWEAPADYAPLLHFAEYGRGDVGVRPLDLTGDGILDLVQSYKRSSDDDQRLAQVNVTPRGYLLARLTDGLGASASIAYRSFLQQGAAGIPVRADPGQRFASAYPIVNAPLPGFLVFETRTDAPGVPVRTMQYRYDGNRVDLLSGRSMGFAVRVQRDVDRNRITTTTFMQEDGLIGMPSAVEVRQGSALISRTSTSWATVRSPGIADPRAPPNFTPTIVRRELRRNAAESFAMDGTLLKGEQSEFTYDDHANATQVVVRRADGSASLTKSDYGVEDETKWVLGRLTRTNVTLSAPGAADESKTSAFAYDPSTGLLREERALVGTTFEVVTTYERDSFGNKLGAILTAADGSLARKTTFTSDPEGRFVVATTNALGHVTRNEIDPVSGAVTRRIDPNGVSVQMVFDDLQQEVTEVAPNKVRTTIETSFSTAPGTVIAVRRSSPGAPTTTIWTDGAGRTVRLTKTGWHGRLVTVTTSYDRLGRIAAADAPHFEGGRAAVTRREYDEMDRLIQETTPDGRARHWSFAGRTETASDQAGHASKRVHDLQGRIIKTIDTMGGTTEFKFDAAGRTVATINALGQTIVQRFNLAGQRTDVFGPSSGHWTYAYNVYGELISQTDPRGITTTNAFDQLGRVISRKLPSSEARWIYDNGPHAVGKLIAVESDGNHKRSITYDELGREVLQKVVVGQDKLTVASVYDRLGRLQQRRYDTGVTLTNSYNELGFWTGVDLRDGELTRHIYSLLAVDAVGRVTAQEAGNGIRTSARFDELTGRLSSMKTSSAVGVAEDLAITYDDVGNVSTLSDAASGERGAFSYDALRRLTLAEQNGLADVAVRYDALGNITFKSGVGDYEYCDRAALLHVLCAVKNRASGARNLAYDAAGDIIAEGDRQLTFNEGGKAGDISSATGRTRFTYDADGNVETQDSLYFAKATKYAVTYLPGVQVLRENFTPPHLPTSQRTRVRHMLVGPDGLIGFYDKVFRHYPYRFAAPIYGRIVTDMPERVSDLRVGLAYVVKDENGSIRAVLDEDGKVLQRYRYDPWGAEATHVYRYAREGFTGQQQLENIGLVQMGGRVYDPVLGRFLSADAFIQDRLYSQSFNPFAYAFNNPLTFIDPTGYKSFWKSVGDFVSGGAKVFGDILDATVGKPLSWVGEQLGKGGRWLQQNWQTVAVIAIACVMPAAAAWYWAVLEGAALGGLTAALYGGGPDEILRGALIGGISGGAFYGAGTFISNPANNVGNLGGAAIHGTVGGLSSVAQGGDFRSGFLSAAVTKYSGSYIDPNGGQAYQVTAAAVVGGLSSEVGGGNFENGAITGAFSRLFNDLSHPVEGYMEAAVPDGRGPASGSDYNPDDWSYWAEGDPLSVWSADYSLDASVGYAMGSASISNTGEFSGSLTFGPPTGPYVSVSSDGTVGGGWQQGINKVLSVAGGASIGPNGLGVNAGGSIGPVSGTASGYVKVVPGPGAANVLKNLENAIIRWMNRGYCEACFAP